MDPIITAVTTQGQISFASSPVHCTIQNSAQDNTIRNVKMELYMWSGMLVQDLGLPNVTLQKDIVSQEDNYISFEISDILKSYIEQPKFGMNINQPGFGYNVNALPAVSGLGIFWQVVAEVTSTTGVEIIQYNTNFATLGWQWNYEQTGTQDRIVRNGSLGFNKPIVKWYNPNIPKYWKQEFIFTNELNAATTTNMISLVVEPKPANRIRCSKESALIVYLDKRGLWDAITTHGKIIAGSKPESQFSKRLFRSPTKVNSTIAHSRSRNWLNVEQKWTINTGTIDESEVQRIEELLYSPKIYLIRFAGDVVTQITGGTTIDSTFVTIDDTDITIDNTPIIPTQVPYFATYQQIPVTIEDEEFIRKTLINDKASIDYTIKLTETTNKINDIR